MLRSSLHLSFQSCWNDRFSVAICLSQNLRSSSSNALFLMVVAWLISLSIWCRASDLHSSYSAKDDDDDDGSPRWWADGWFVWGIGLLLSIAVVAIAVVVVLYWWWFGVCGRPPPPPPPTGRAVCVAGRIDWMGWMGAWDDGGVWGISMLNLDFLLLPRCGWSELRVVS